MIKIKEDLEQFIICNWDDINTYLDQCFEGMPTPLYSSVDIRESKHKFAPVDHNIYPAGFNNVCALDLDSSVDHFRKSISMLTPGIKTIAIIPESNTKNTFYLDHLAILGKTIRDAGYEVYFTSPDENLFDGAESIQLISHSKYDLEIFKTTICEDGFICLGGLPGVKVELAILNNDQSSPLDFAWDKIKTPVHPTPKIGWFQRQKSNHFKFYKQVLDEFCLKFSIDPNLLRAQDATVEDIDFSSKEGLEKLSIAVDQLKGKLDSEAKIFVKASQGTYGMGISVVSSGEEILNMNRKKRNKMDIGKNKIKFTSVLLQEGIETILKYDEMPAEIAIYLINGNSIGGFMRANREKGSQENLNSKGMVFEKFCISEIKQNNDHKAKESVYTVIARLATLASSYEIKEVL